MPLVSVIIPVYNRQRELQRALQSIADQSLTDLECLVVDDGSTEPIKPVVDDFDERFSYLRLEANSGPTAARLIGCAHVSGDLVTILDSDNEYFPWTLARAVHYFEKYPQAGAVTGLYVFPDGLRARIPEGERLVTPSVYAGRLGQRPGSDSVLVVRRAATTQWRELRRDYFNLDLVILLSLHMSTTFARVDEPWGRFHTDAAERMSTRQDPRSRGLDDIEKFVREFRPRFGATPCGPLDVALTNMWVRLLRAHRYDEAAAVAQWLRERGISRWSAIGRKARWALDKRIARARRSGMHTV